jgi:alpha-L-rhamnosidase
MNLRRVFAALLVIGGTSTLSVAAENVQTIEANHVAEFSFVSGKTYQNPFMEVVLDALVTTPDGAQMRVPAIWAGDNRWAFRFASNKPGTYAWTLDCSDTGNSSLHRVAGKIKVVPYRGDTARSWLNTHGRLLSAGRNLTACPQRNERCGYTGDAQFFMRAAVYNMDVSAFFNKWLVDVCEDAQMPDGHIADRAPHYGTGDSWYIGWGDAGIICPYEIYRNYGDTRVIREHYAAMKRYLDAMSRNSKDGLFTGNIGGGDWLATGGGVTDDVMGTAYLALDFKLMAEMAEAIGETRDAATFHGKVAEVTKAFAKAYIDAEGNIKESSQSGFALAFTIGLVPPSLKEKMTARFTQEARRFDWHPRTGFVGTPRLLPGLHLAGLDEDAYKLLLIRTAPSWLYPVSVGATTIWEQWESWDGKNAQGGMNSLNHYAFGSVGEYLYGMIGGIQADAPGYKRIRIQPVICEGLTWANTRYGSIHGKIVSNWKREGDQLTMEVTIPANTSATVHVPAKDAAAVTEGGNTIDKVKGVKFLRMENNAAVYAVGSGTYQFQSTLPETVK